MANLDNVKTLNADGASTCELALDLHKWAEKGHAVDAVVIHRGPDGALAINYTAQSTAEISEIAHYLHAFACNLIWNENISPVMEDGEECDTD